MYKQFFSFQKKDPNIEDYNCQLHPNPISEICEGAALENGRIDPSEVIEGSVVTVNCDQDFKVEGPWELTCQNGTWGQKLIEGKTRCARIRSGMRNVISLMIYLSIALPGHGFFLLTHAN